MNWLDKRRFAEARKLAVEEMTTKGFTLVKGSEIPLDARNARRLVDRITDEQIKLKGGSIFQNLWKWIVDHKEQILAVLKIILTLVMLFLQAGGHPDMPDYGFNEYTGMCETSPRLTVRRLRDWSFLDID